MVISKYLLHWAEVDSYLRSARYFRHSTILLGSHSERVLPSIGVAEERRCVMTDLAIINGLIIDGSGSAG